VPGVAQAMRLIFIILPHRLSVGTFPCTDGATVQKASLPTKVNFLGSRLLNQKI